MATPTVVPTKLFVGNITKGSDVALLRAEFENFGAVAECDIISDYGFVHYNDPGEADAAQAGMNGVMFNGQQLKVEKSTSYVRQKPGFGKMSSGKCYVCGGSGHWAKGCPDIPEEERMRQNQRADRQRQHRGSRGGGDGPPRGRGYYEDDYDDYYPARRRRPPPPDYYDDYDDYYYRPRRPYPPPPPRGYYDDLYDDYPPPPRRLPPPGYYRGHPDDDYPPPRPRLPPREMYRPREYDDYPRLPPREGMPPPLDDRDFDRRDYARTSATDHALPSAAAGYAAATTGGSAYTDFASDDPPPSALLDESNIDPLAGKGYEARPAPEHYRRPAPARPAPY